MRMSDWSSDVCSSDLMNEVARNCGRRRHCRTHEMATPSRPLTALEIAVRGGGTALSGRQPVLVHTQAHRTARIKPFETRVGAHAFKAFGFGLRLDQPRSQDLEV